MNIKQRQLLIRILKKMTQNPEYAKTHGLCDVSSIKVSRQKTQPQPDTSQSADIPCLQSFDQSQSGTSLSADTPYLQSFNQPQRDTSQSADIPCLQSFDQSQSGTSLSADTPSRSSSGQAQPQS